jgi:hypothetical protein
MYIIVVCVYAYVRVSMCKYVRMQLVVSSLKY